MSSCQFVPEGENNSALSPSSYRNPCDSFSLSFGEKYTGNVFPSTCCIETFDAFFIRKMKTGKILIFTQCRLFSSPAARDMRKERQQGFFLFSRKFMRACTLSIQIALRCGHGRWAEQKKVYFFSAVAAVPSQKSGCVSLLLPLSFM